MSMEVLRKICVVFPYQVLMRTKCRAKHFEGSPLRSTADASASTRPSGSCRTFQSGPENSHALEVVVRAINPASSVPSTDRPVAVSVYEASEIMRVSKSTVYRLVDCGRLKGVRLGRRLLIPWKAIEDLFEA